MNASKILKRILIMFIALMIVVAGLVILFDPMYHYHKPLPGLKAVLSDKEYQCIGSLKNFDYDAVIAGSSMAENYDNSWFDEDFGCRSVKAIRSYGITSDVCFYVDTAFEHQDVKKVFYNVDMGNFMDMPLSCDESFESAGFPMYLFDSNPLNDVKYLYNKDVIFNKIPHMLAKSFSSDYEEGQSYNWWQYKEFGEDVAISNYTSLEEVLPMTDVHVYDESLNANIDLIEGLVKNHPDAEFYFFIPPYSILWWDNVYREGDLEFYLYAADVLVDRLSAYNNVKISFFMDEEDIITNLDNYMDSIHFTPEINHYIEQCLYDGSKEINKDNKAEKLENMKALAYHMEYDLIPEYADRLEYCD